MCAHPNFTVINGDIRRDDVMKPLVDSNDIIIPLAALVGALFMQQRYNRSSHDQSRCNSYDV